MEKNQNPDFEEVETELKETGIAYFWGKDAEEAIELDKQGKLKWRPYTKEEREKLEERLDHLRHLNSLVRKPILALVEGTGLTPEEARTVIYWTTATHGLDVLDTFPPLVLHGKPETGKSFTLETIATLIGLTRDDFISVTTPAAFRDQLSKHRIVLIEEGDNEELILKLHQILGIYLCLGVFTELQHEFLSDVVEISSSVFSPLAPCSCQFRLSRSTILNTR